MTEQQHLRLLALQYELKKIVLPVGAMHSLWEEILDIQALLDGKEMLLKRTAEKMIIQCEQYLKDRGIG